MAKGANTVRRIHKKKTKMNTNKTTPLGFIRQVRAELAKVTWPTARETRVSVIAVFIMVTIASIFLYFADQLIAFLVGTILSIGK